MEFNLDIEQYIINHITPESAILQELNRKTHLQILRSRMLSGHIQGNILKVICQMIQPKCVLEIGTFTGYSAICMASGMEKESRLHTIEINDELIDFTNYFFEKSGYQNIIKQHIGSAIDIIPTIDETFDLVFLDGDKREYPEYYNLVINKLKPGGIILADNILWDGKVIEPLEPNDEQTKAILEFNRLVVEDERVEVSILPIRDGISIIRKKS